MSDNERPVFAPAYFTPASDAFHADMNRFCDRACGRVYRCRTARVYPHGRGASALPNAFVVNRYARLSAKESTP